MFVCSLHIPEREVVLTMNLALPDGRRVRLRGVVVRSYCVAPNLRRVKRSGFCVRLIEAPEDYFVLVADLLQLQLPEPEDESGEPEVLADFLPLRLPEGEEPEEFEESPGSPEPEDTKGAQEPV